MVEVVATVKSFQEVLCKIYDAVYIPYCILNSKLVTDYVIHIFLNNNLSRLKNKTYINEVIKNALCNTIF